MVVCEFCMGNFVSPEDRVGSTKDPQISFNFLVDSFRFSVRLRVVGGGEGNIVVKEFPEFFWQRWRQIVAHNQR